MVISNFDDLLKAARSQQDPQRLLFVFAGIELPDDATAEQRQEFEAGHGGALVPLMYVDKRPDELSSFSALTDEATSFGHQWGMVFAAAMSGQENHFPSSDDAEAPLLKMVEAIKRGDIGTYIPFDRHGDAVQLG